MLALLPAILGAVVALVQVLIPVISGKPVTENHMVGAGASLGVGVVGSAAAKRKRGD